jgi:hypothetical protein
MSDAAVINPFFISIDVVQEAIQQQSLFDYFKANLRKEVVVLNAAELTDSSLVRSTKSEIRASPSQAASRSRSIVRALRQRIDAEMTKALDAKKKYLAHIERLRAAAMTGKNQRAKSRHAAIPEEQPRFQGKVDLVFVIHSFPYLPNQLQMLIEGGINLDSFVAIVPPAGAQPHPVELQSLKGRPSADMPTSGSRSIRAPTVAKRGFVPGACLDSSTNPDCYPPARWTAIRPTAPFAISFLEVKGNDDMGVVFRQLEELIIRIVSRKSLLTDFLADRRLAMLPAVTPKTGSSVFADYLRQYPEDCLGRLYLELKTDNWATSDPKPPPTTHERFIELFEQSIRQSDRRYVADLPESVIDRIFTPDVMPSVYPLLYKLKQWKIIPDRARRTISYSRFIRDRKNFHAYVGQKFDQLFAATNKKWQLGSPLPFFDWQKWDLSVDHANACDQLRHAGIGSSVVETLLDDDLGILYVFFMPPVPRAIGSYVSKCATPPTVEGCDEWLDKLSDLDGLPVKRPRLPPTPASVVKEKGDFRTLLPPLETRFQSKEKVVYRLPLAISNSTEFITPYFLGPGLEVRIIRDLVGEEMRFRYGAIIHKALQIESTADTLLITSPEVFRVVVTFPFVVTFFIEEDHSIALSDDQLVLKSTNRLPSIITKEGHLIACPAGPKSAVIVMNDGTVGRQSTAWKYVQTDGQSFKHIKSRMKPLKLPHSKVTDIRTGVTQMIRPDDIQVSLDHTGIRTLVYGQSFSVVQRPSGSITFNLGNFPEIQLAQNVFRFSVGGINVQISEGAFEFTTEDFRTAIKPNLVNLSIVEIESFMSPTHCEFKLKNRVVYAAADGTERTGELAAGAQPKNKKLELVETHWGPLLPPSKPNLGEQEHFSLLSLFQPRFFVIRGDLSGVEFVRTDTLNMSGADKRLHEVAAEEGRIGVVTCHTPSNDPFCYLKYDTLSKLDRMNLLKTVEIERPSKKKSEHPDEAELALMATNSFTDYLTRSAEFRDSLQRDLSDWSAQYFADIEPPQSPPPEVLNVPPQTPTPRRLNAARHQHTPVDERGYWDSHESDFAFPLYEDAKDQRAVSPRTGIFDPPHCFRREKPAKPPEEMFCTQKTPITLNREKPAHTARPLSASTATDVVDFGDVPAGSKHVRTVRVKSHMVKPVQFRVDHIPNQMVHVLNPRGLMAPGLPQLVKVEVEADPPTDTTIAESVQIHLPTFDLSIPLRAIVKARPPPEPQKAAVVLGRPSDA